METISEQVSTPKANSNTGQGAPAGDVMLIKVKVFNLDKIVGTAPFNRYPIPVYFINPDFLKFDFPFAVFDPMGPIGVIGLKTIRFDLQNDKTGEKIYASSFVRKFETQGKPPMVGNTVLSRDSQAVEINPVPVDRTHVEYYDLWFEFKDEEGVIQYAMIDPTLQANQRE